MFSLDLSFKFKDVDFSFKAECEKGKPHIFEAGEEALADRLFAELIFSGLEPNILALGDKTMFIRGSVSRNIYKALRFRSNKKTARSQLETALDEYSLRDIAQRNIKQLSDEQLFAVALARSHFRTADLLVVKKIGGYIKKETKINFEKWPDAYIIEIV